MTPTEKHRTDARQVLVGRRLAFAEESGPDALIDGIAAALAKAEHEASANLIGIIADIRQKSGVGAKPMLGELADAIAARIEQAEREGMKRAAEIARGSSGEFDFQSALGEGRDFDYGFHNGKNHAADSILATIIIDKSNSPDSPLVGAKAGEAGSSSLLTSPATNPDDDIPTFLRRDLVEA